MVIARVKDSGEEGMTREEFMRYRYSERADNPHVVVHHRGMSDADRVKEVLAAVAERYNTPAADILVAFSFPSRRLRAAVAAASRDVHCIHWDAIASVLGYSNPRTSVQSARKRHADLIAEVSALIRKDQETQ